jgi:hypothetical protein
MNQYDVPKKFLNINIECMANGKVGIKTEKNGKEKCYVEGNKRSRGSFQAFCQTGHLKVCMFRDKEKEAHEEKRSI